MIARWIMKQQSKFLGADTPERGGIKGPNGAHDFKAHLAFPQNSCVQITSKPRQEKFN